MPVPVDMDKVQLENVWQYCDVDSHRYSTGGSLYYKNISESFFNSKTGEDFSKTYLIFLETQHNETNKTFIKYSNFLAKQYSNIPELEENFSLEEIKTSTSKVINNLITLCPDAFSLELTNEESVFYTLKKDDYSFYLHQYFETEADGFNATLIIFKGNQKTDTINGNISDLIVSIEQFFPGSFPENFNLVLFNELSH